MNTRLVNSKILIFDISGKREYNKCLKLYDKIHNIIRETGSRGLTSEETDPTIIKAIELEDLIINSIMDYNYKNANNDKSTNWKNINLDRVG